MDEVALPGSLPVLLYRRKICVGVETLVACFPRSRRGHQFVVGFFRYKKQQTKRSSIVKCRKKKGCCLCVEAIYIVSALLKKSGLPWNVTFISKTIERLVAISADCKKVNDLKPDCKKVDDLKEPVVDLGVVLDPSLFMENHVKYL
ncbi:hypothetical protein HELRODRAFT_176173 [Helobdella robusta]|uniref:Uncharacterized protein n=1 Tax=Helobdella robusta TaxID=6412 RepID=T1FA89_HELRO|nr:hypothetical protein HELRODRAFT_176173 [Helobdella robusta]ESO00304.1 hypothetical protein HELRODRAFT_176173 [Helobdella robusta]